MDRRIVGVVLAVLLTRVLGVADEAEAIPAFARKYETSCQTCHVALPKVNPFGEAFRMNGLEWPGGFEEEEAKTKDDPVPLGAEAYKRVFPDAVWPGAIPRGVPISFRARTGFNWQDLETGSRSEFESPTLQTMMAGTLGEGVAFFVGAHLFEDGSFDAASVDRFYMGLNDVFRGTLGENALDLRIGQFIPEIVTFATNHRGLTITPYAFTTWSPAAGESFGAEHAHPDGGHAEAGALHEASALLRDEGHEDLEGPLFGIENFQLGVEANGIVGSRFRYAVGLVNGGLSAETNADKDVYLRIAYKVGGMAFDGTGGATDSNRNWAENSVAVGAFGYRGLAYDEMSFGPEELEIQRAGTDVNWYWSDLNIYGGYLHGRDDMVGVDGVRRVEFDMFFGELNYVVYPWLVGVLRYEEANSDLYAAIRRVVPHITALYRANIKFQVESRLDPDDLTFDNLLFGLDFAY